MSPEKPPIDVVELDSSDDEGAGVIGKRKPDLPHGGNSLSKSPVIENPNAIVPSNYRPLESRSFWKAGNFEVGRIKSTAIHGSFSSFNFLVYFFAVQSLLLLPTWLKFILLVGELEHARVHPKFLHSNATSHKWAFGGKLYYCVLFHLHVALWSSFKNKWTLDCFGFDRSLIL